MGEHDGHRKRLRVRFAAGIAGRYSDLELLELLLCYALPRYDVAPLARELLDRAGGIGGLIGKPMEELVEYKGVGESTALLLALTGEASNRSEEQRQKNAVLNSPARVREYIRSRLLFAREDVAYAIDLDMDLRPLACVVLTGGESEQVQRILRMALNEGGRTVTVAVGASEDLPAVTGGYQKYAERMHETLQGLGITLLDYIRIHNDFYASAAELGLLRDGEPVRERYRASLTGYSRKRQSFKVDNIFDD